MGKRKRIANIAKTKNNRKRKSGMRRMKNSILNNYEEKVADNKRKRKKEKEKGKKRKLIKGKRKKEREKEKR